MVPPIGKMMTQYTSNTKRFCSVYKSKKKQEMYLYIDRADELTSLPDALMQIFGQAEHVMDVVLTPEKKLARADANKVLEDIAEKGFYLQMPPAKDPDMLDLYKPPKDSLHG
jgi:uncharacterized protein YcgL (UPF0745 family)